MSPHCLMVANRSEIACRIFQAAEELGISTVAIFVEGDEEARHVTLADRAVKVAGYLDVDSILAAARQEGVTLIHPGYGFLSERPHFAKAVVDAGIGFLGPLAESMEALGGKIAAKEIAEELGIPTVPWGRFDSAKMDAKALEEAAERVGFPLLIKAHAGGGGKGMRKVADFSGLMEAAESAAREAQAAFGDGTLFFERYLQNPRHIEVQVFGNGRGEGIHLHERECSLQRRHQKVWEEAPAMGLPENVRKGMLESSLKLVRHTRYRSAGTVEFLVEVRPDGTIEEFFFIEMNTRLQVEHPVTEAVTGVDLVHEQIRLGLDPENYRFPEVGAPRGHAIEVRVCSEDPAQEFMPCTGRIEVLRLPSGPGIRVDRGIEEGQELGTRFDSMCAKIIVHAPTRALSIRRMQYALRETVIAGVGTNLDYLNRIAHEPEVIAGKVSTFFLDQKLSSYRPEVPEALLGLLEAWDRGGSLESAGSEGLGSDSARLWRSNPL